MASGAFLRGKIPANVTRVPRSFPDVNPGMNLGLDPNRGRGIAGPSRFAKDVIR